METKISILHPQWATKAQGRGRPLRFTVPIYLKQFAQKHGNLMKTVKSSSPILIKHEN
jgi:hypothetical protein